jgi:hypothetical protein
LRDGDHAMGQRAEQGAHDGLGWSHCRGRRSGGQFMACRARGEASVSHVVAMQAGRRRLLDGGNPELDELLGVDRAGGAGHQVGSLLGLGEGDDVANGLGLG